MFVIGGNCSSSIEIFDSFFRKFTLFNLTNSRAMYCSTVQAISVGCKIVIFSMKDNKTKVYTYDFINNFWCDHEIRVLENLTDISRVKYSTC